jgi:hypothetical protein
MGARGSARGARIPKRRLKILRRADASHRDPTSCRVVITLAETLERNKTAAIQAGAKQVSLPVPAVDGVVVVLVFTNEEDPLLPPAGVQSCVFKLEEMEKLTKMKVDFSTVITAEDGRKVVNVATLVTVGFRTLTIVLDDPNVSYGAPPLRVSPQPVEEAAESSDSEGGGRRLQKKLKPKKHPTFETQEHKDKSHNRWSFFLEADHPVAQFFKELTEAANNGTRPLVGSGSCAKFADKLGFRVGYGRAQSKWKYSVLKKVEELSPELFKSRSSKDNTAAKAPLTDDERAQLEDAFQATLNTWYESTATWVEEDNQAAGQMRQPRRVTWKEANEKLYFERKGYEYAHAEPDKPPM